MKLIGAVPVEMVGARLNTPVNRAHGERLLGAGPGAATCAGNISRAEHFDIGLSYAVEPAGMPDHRNIASDPAACGV
jgi:hypothetical protein